MKDLKINYVDFFQQTEQETILKKFSLINPKKLQHELKQVEVYIVRSADVLGANTADDAINHVIGASLNIRTELQLQRIAPALPL